MNRGVGTEVGSERFKPKRLGVLQNVKAIVSWSIVRAGALGPKC